MLFKDRRNVTENPSEERRSGSDRRQGRRVPLGLDFAVPVVVRHQDREEPGLARNISEGGMLVQLDRTLPIGSRIEVRFTGLSGASVKLQGEVRHQVAWQHSGGPDRQIMYGIGVRFVDGPGEELPTTEWVQSGCNTTLH